ncbi:MAG TPA: acyl-CoA dehydrogenase family protein [Acidimicrobiales bacterium]|nr:acyl-CoA dehydrogenase family protein [Acidimicrobiales bacterium]
MRFAFTEQQTQFRDAVRQVLDKECTPDDLRSVFDAPEARSRRWATLAEMGVTGLTVPEALGGLGLHLLDLVPLLEEAGRAALPEPLIETTALAAPLLAGFPSDPAAAWLEGMASGKITAAVAPVDRTGSVPASMFGTSVVPAADGADLFILPTAPKTGDLGTVELHAVSAAYVTVSPVASLDPTRRLGTVGWEPSPATLIASGAQALSALRDLADRAAVATAAELLGLADRMISIAAAYAKERNQFGKPIGSFQAVKHLLAGAQVKLEFARPTVYGAAWALGDEALAGSPRAVRSASLAKAYASDAATEAARVSLQVHGAIGYTWECDLHLFLKRAWALAESWGSAADHRRRILSSLVDETNPAEV